MAGPLEEHLEAIPRGLAPGCLRVLKEKANRQGGP